MPGLLQKVGIDSKFASGNDNGSHRRLVKLNRSRTADDSVDIAEFTQSPQRGNQQSAANSLATRALEHAGGPKESAASAFIPGKSNDLSFPRCEVNSHRLIGKADRNFISPGPREILTDEVAHSGNFERTSAPNIEALKRGRRQRQFKQVNQQIRHNALSLANKAA